MKSKSDTAVMLLMTATIAPSNNMPGAAQLDPEKRIIEYMDALDFYLSIDDKCIDRILFVDNSGYDLSKLELLVEKSGTNKRVQFISFVSTIDPSMGKGRSELNLMDYGIEHCKFGLNPTDKIWKVTGRLKIVNIEKLISTAPMNYQLYADFRAVPFIGEALGGNQWMDCRVFSVSYEGYGAFIYNEYRQLTSSVVEKHFFAKFFPMLKTNNELYPRFKQQPKIDGSSGRLLKSYSSGSYKWKYYLRKVSRSAVPWLWL